MKYLVDTNILLRLVQKNSPMHLNTQRAILKLKKQGEFLCIIPQNITKYN
jgi:predicted nucleic acid-binding protein